MVAQPRESTTDPWYTAAHAATGMTRTSQTIAGADPQRGADAAAGRAVALHPRSVRRATPSCTRRGRASAVAPGMVRLPTSRRTASPTSRADPAGQRIGPYRIVRSLGQGGMGEVFLAERADDQFQQQVAIKLVQARAAVAPRAGPPAAGTADPRVAGSSEHRAPVRRRHDQRRHAVHRHGVRRRRADRHVLRPPQPDDRAAAAAVHDGVLAPCIARTRT